MIVGFLLREPLFLCTNVFTLPHSQSLAHADRHGVKIVIFDELRTVERKNFAQTLVYGQFFD